MFWLIGTMWCFRPYYIFFIFLCLRRIKIWVMKLLTFCFSQFYPALIFLYLFPFRPLFHWCSYYPFPLSFFLSFFLPVLLYILLFSFFLSLFLSFYLSFFVPIYLSLSLTIFLSSFPCILLTSSHNCSLLRLPTGLTLTYQKWKGDNTYFSLYSNLQTHKLVCIYYSTSSLPHPLS